MPVLAQRHAVEVELEADAAAARPSRDVEDASPAAPRSCSDDEQAALDELERALDQLLARERVADLDARPLRVVALVDVLRGEHRGAADAVAAGARAEQDDEVARRRRRARAAAPRRRAGRRTSRSRGSSTRSPARRRPRRRRSARRRSCRSGRCRGRSRRTAGGVRSLPSAPKRSESSTAIGRAPIAKMSRRMPPTPVAAPWNGSTADGWLWLSTLKATARPSPTSITPAFSPGPCSTRAPVGRQRAQEQGASACSRSAPTRAARRRRARRRSARARARRRSRSSSPSVRPRRRCSGRSATGCTVLASYATVRHRTRPGPRGFSTRLCAATRHGSAALCIDRAACETTPHRRPVPSPAPASAVPGGSPSSPRPPSAADGRPGEELVLQRARHRRRPARAARLPPRRPMLRGPVSATPAALARRCSAPREEGRHRRVLLPRTEVGMIARRSGRRGRCSLISAPPGRCAAMRGTARWRSAIAAEEAGARGPRRLFAQCRLGARRGRGVTRPGPPGARGARAGSAGSSSRQLVAGRDLLVLVVLVGRRDAPARARRPPSPRPTPAPAAIWRMNTSDADSSSSG